MTGTRCTIPRKWNCCNELVSPQDLEKHLLSHQWSKKE